MSYSFDFKVEFPLELYIKPFYLLVKSSKRLSSPEIDNNKPVCSYYLFCGLFIFNLLYSYLELFTYYSSARRIYINQRFIGISSSEI